MINQQGDVLLYQSNDGGEINITDGLVEMSGGLETAVYLSLFGGNEDDDGSAFNWWGNLDENETARQYRSETQNLLQSIPAISRNLRRIEDAAQRDLQWMIDTKVADSVDVSAVIPDLNKVAVTVTINATNSIEYLENWKADI